MPQKSKLNAEEKVEIIRKYQQGEISLAQAAREASVETATIYRWSTRYEAEGAGGFLSYQKNRVYPSELKLKAVQEYLSGHGSLESVCEKYEIRSTSQLRSWIKVYSISYVRVQQILKKRNISLTWRRCGVFRQNKTPNS